MSRNPDTYSPVFDPLHPKPETGRLHDWQQHDGPYYGSAYICGNCGEKSWGWNLWKENFQPTCPGSSEPVMSEPVMDVVTLRNGAEEASALVTAIMITVRDLLKSNPIAFYELVSLCRDGSHQLFGNAGDVLKTRALVVDSRTVHESIRNIVLSATEGDGLDMTLGSPTEATP